jgi:hypothetical protein
MRCRLWLLALALVSCYSPNKPMCSFQCGTDAGVGCPEDYTCFPDGYCHLKGTTGECVFPTPDQSGVGDAGTSG